MKRAGVIGYPLGHSLSPIIFQAAFDAAGIDARYEAWPTSPDELAARVAGLRDDGVLGANVTIPHKEAVIPLLDRIDARARRVGAVNTIANQGGQLAGYNTDVAGFGRSLREDAGFDPLGKRALLLGAGGAARAVALALIEGGAAAVCVAGRTPERAQQLIADLHGMAGETVLSAARLDAPPMAGVDLIVNCTPLGTRGSEGESRSPIAAELLTAGAVVFDLVYNPPETPLVLAARERGATAVSGLGMLVYQAAESFRIWTERDAAVAAMLEAGRRALAAEVAR